MEANVENQTTYFHDAPSKQNCLNSLRSNIKESQSRRRSGKVIQKKLKSKLSNENNCIIIYSHTFADD